jgi:hypothetical protein
MNKYWIIIDMHKNVLYIDPEELYKNEYIKEYISRNINKVIRNKTLKELDNTIHKIIKERK